MVCNEVINSEGTARKNRKPRIREGRSSNIKNDLNLLVFGYRLPNNLVTVELTLEYISSINLLYKHFV